MTQIKNSQFQQALDTVEALPPDDQQALVELVQHRLAERRRYEIAQHASETLGALRTGKVCKGSLDDLKRDLLVAERKRSRRRGIKISVPERVVYR
jgi:hypothetical protein